ncbi:Ahi1 protein [Pelomyxa schiedti]|nr:Ahi1 protein [Pelomyxa schiedti]
MARLQLYKYTQKTAVPAAQVADIPNVFWLWKKGKPIKYPSTIYVTVSAKKQPRPQNLLVKNTKSTNSNEDRGTESGDRENSSEDEDLLQGDKPEVPAIPEHVKKPWWQKTPEAPFHVPNMIASRLTAGKNGHYLAVVCVEPVMYTVKVFNVHTWQCIQTFIGHHSITHDISWLHDDSCILTASSDLTAKVWELQSPHMWEKPPGTPPTHTATPSVTLHHPVFVYCAVFKDSRTVITGAFDNNLRVWSIPDATLLQVVEGHSSHINSLAFVDGRMGPA